MTKITINLHDFKFSDGFEALEKYHNEYTTADQRWTEPFFLLSDLEQSKMCKEMDRLTIFRYLTQVLKIEETIVAYLLYTDVEIDYGYSTIFIKKDLK